MTPVTPAVANAAAPSANFERGAALLHVSPPERPLKLTRQVAPETLCDATVLPLAQTDGPIPTRAATPAYLPDPATIAEERSLVVPDVPAGTYEVRLALYSPATGTRIAAADRAAVGDHVSVERLTVAP